MLRQRIKRLLVPSSFFATDLIVNLVGLPKDARLVMSSYLADKREMALYFESDEFEEVHRGEEPPNLPLMLPERWR